MGSWEHSWVSPALSWVLFVADLALLVFVLRWMPRRFGGDSYVVMGWWWWTWTSLVGGLVLIAPLFGAIALSLYAPDWVTTAVLWVLLVVVIGDVTWMVRRRRQRRGIEVA